MDSIFLKACRREKTPLTPIWLMRQAGRYMKEYRSVREKVGFLELCKKPDLAAEVTVKAVEVLGVDAAIIFADILLITEPLGFKLEFLKDGGPVLHNPFRSRKDLERMTPPHPREALGFVAEAIRRTRTQLKADIPVIGFAGAPFTVASYAIEGGGSKDFARTKTLMREDPETFRRFLAVLTDATVEYLKSQIEAGAGAVQVFDSWVGCLSGAEYRDAVLPHMKRLFSLLPSAVPALYFGTGTAPFLEDFASAGAGVVGVDSHIRLDEARERVGNRAIQGNLDPTVLFSTPEIIRREAARILKEAGGTPGHIFNLGHGILPHTPVDHVKVLVDFVHEHSSR